MGDAMKNTILLADDDEINIKLLEALLAPEGYSLVFAKDGKEALERLDSSGANLVLLDLMLPKLSGFEVLKRIRGDGKYAALPVIIITALKDRDNMKKGLSLGADDYISKPFDTNELLYKVAAQLKMNSFRKQSDRISALISSLASLNEGVIITDGDFVPTNVNSKARELLGMEDVPVDLMKFFREQFDTKVTPGPRRAGFLLQHKHSGVNNQLLSLIIEPVKAKEACPECYVFILNKQYGWK